MRPTPKHLDVFCSMNRLALRRNRNNSAKRICQRLAAGLARWTVQEAWRSSAMSILLASQKDTPCSTSNAPANMRMVTTCLTCLRDKHLIEADLSILQDRPYSRIRPKHITWQFVIVKFDMQSSKGFHSKDLSRNKCSFRAAKWWRPSFRATYTKEFRTLNREGLMIGLLFITFLMVTRSTPGCSQPHGDELTPWARFCAHNWWTKGIEKPH